MSKGRFVSPGCLASESLRSAHRPLASTPDGCTSGVRLTLRDEGCSGAASGRARAAQNAAATPTRVGRRGAVARSVVGERRSSRKRAGRLRYDPQCGGDPSGMIREPAVPFAWRGIEDRSRRACAGVGSGLVPQCLRRPSVGGPPRGDEESGKPNANNNLDALDRGWRGARATYIARVRFTCRKGKCGQWIINPSLVRPTNRNEASSKGEN